MMYHKRTHRFPCEACYEILLLTSRSWIVSLSPECPPQKWASLAAVWENVKGVAVRHSTVNTYLWGLKAPWVLFMVEWVQVVVDDYWVSVLRFTHEDVETTMRALSHVWKAQCLRLSHSISLRVHKHIDRRLFLLTFRSCKEKQWLR